MLEGFLDAVRDRPPGPAAATTVILNGFAARGDAAEHAVLAAAAGADVVWTPAPVQDVNAYAVAARQASEPLVCLMNSYARPLEAGWLARLHAGLEAGGAAAAAATGSWESHATELRLRERVRRSRGARDLAGGVYDWVAYRGRFPRFPNPHLRTNGLLCPRELIVDVMARPARTKLDAYERESGRRGVSRRAAAGGRPLVVVGRDGRAYPPAEWPASRTWRSGEQENLLIADNRTEEWRAASPAERAAMARRSWGRDADV